MIENIQKLTLDGEEWLPIEGVSNYLVSNKGRVLSMKWQGKLGKVGILRPIKDSDGYLKVVLYSGTHQLNRMVHRLVANAFIPNPMRQKKIIMLKILSGVILPIIIPMAVGWRKLLNLSVRQLNLLMLMVLRLIIVVCPKLRDADFHVREYGSV